MSKKKTYLNDHRKQNLEGIEGFKDVLDLIDPNGPDIHNIKNQQIEDYEIYDFLEKENLRLEKLDQFFSTHLPIDRKYSQTRGLIEKEREEIGHLREELIEACLKEDSGINNYLRDLFKRAF